MSNINSLSTILLFTGGFFLFEFMLFIFYYLDISRFTSSANIAYRGIFLGFCMMLIVRHFSQQTVSKNKFMLWLFFGFWALYLLRIFYHSFILGMPARYSGNEYLIRTIGMTIIPSLSFLFVDFSILKSRGAMKGIILLLAVIIAISILYLSQFSGVSIRRLSRIGYMRSEILGPHSVSYLGASVFATLVAVLTHNKLPKFWYGFALCISGLSLYPMVQGGSRGALLAAVFTVTLIFVFGRFSILKRVVLVFSVILTIGVTYLFIRESTALNFMTLRLESLFLKYEYDPYSAAGGRLMVFQETVSQILRSPFWGDSLVVASTSNYPHNHILEAFLSTGVLGGLFFVTILVGTFRASITIIRNFPEYSFLVSFFLFSFMAGMVSFDIIRTQFWYSILLVWSVKSQLPLKVFASRNSWNKIS